MLHKIKMILALLMLILFTGCVETPDSEGWHTKQKDEFLEILQHDTYASVCNQASLYAQVKESRNSRLMSRMLIAYVKNLANGCIDLKQFNEAQTARVSLEYASKYTTYLQDVNTSSIKMQLKAGNSIHAILKPFVPEYYQFEALVQTYNRLQKKQNIDPSVLHTVKVNIERIKLMKPGLGSTYILVNIPEFKVRVIENNTTSIAMRVIVGKRNKQTPVFAASLQSIVLNPTWNVPDSIARHELIPKMLKDPNYLKKHRLVMRRNYNLDSPEVHFDNSTYARYIGGKGAVPFKFIEIASSRNALGRVKFLFPNENAVYMHDTPSKWLFKKKVRAYSHGCVRLGEPMKMLRYISEHYSNTPIKKVEEAYKSMKTKYIAITKPLFVHTAYLTAYVEEDGKLHFFNDIYGYDKLQKLNFN